MGRVDSPIDQVPVDVLGGNRARACGELAPHLSVARRVAAGPIGSHKNVYVELPAAVGIEKLVPMALGDQDLSGTAGDFNRTSLSAMDSDEVMCTRFLNQEVQLVM